MKSVAQKNHADARILMRLYMMERFLERLSKSKYSDDFIIKGGILVTSMIGVSMRSTMDIDTTIRNLNLSEEDMKKIVEDIAALDIDDGINFLIKDVSTIMDDMEYPGVRITMDAYVGKTVTPLKIDISTNDIITPRAIEYKYKLIVGIISKEIYICSRNIL
ncbi:nucleotidyl transferase AbiEii/AbiGii toxin family protein [Eubacterium ramulus]